jgi:hypothetical protein
MLQLTKLYILIKFKIYDFNIQRFMVVHVDRGLFLEFVGNLGY